MRFTIACCGLLAAMCLAVGAQKGSVASDETARILSLESAWNGAEASHDAKALSLLLADTFVNTDPDGIFLDKSQWLAHVKSGIDQYEGQLGNSGMMVQMYGNAAVVTGEYHEKIKVKGKMVVHSGRFTDVWIKQNNEWKCAASQSTLISH